MTVWLVRLALVLLPLVILVYWLMLRQRATVSGEDISAKQRSIALIGGILFAILLATLIFIVPFSGNSPDDVYIAPRTENGQIVPGEFISREEAERRGLKPDVPPAPEELETFGD
ncbi:MAG: DUF6111 family protein [Pseudomonadota bacterium]